LLPLVFAKTKHAAKLITDKNKEYQRNGDRMIEMILKVMNPTGLHARPAAQFVQKAASFSSKVKISGNNKVADAKSILSVMSMGLVYGTAITIAAEGEDEKECIEALTALVKSNFGER